MRKGPCTAEFGEDYWRATREAYSWGDTLTELQDLAADVKKNCGWLETLTRLQTLAEETEKKYTAARELVDRIEQQYINKATKKRSRAKKAGADKEEA